MIPVRKNNLRLIKSKTNGIVVFWIVILLFALSWSVYNFYPTIPAASILVKAERFRVERNDFSVNPIADMHQVDGFEFLEDVLPFTNLSTQQNEGLCAGISILEQQYFMGRIDRKEAGIYDLSSIDKPLGSYEMSEISRRAAYADGRKITDVDKPILLLIKGGLKNKSIKDYYWDYLIRSIFTQELDSFLSNSWPVSQKDIREILNAADYIQSNTDDYYSKLEFTTYPYYINRHSRRADMEWEQYIVSDKSDKKEITEKIDIEYIKSKIKSNYPVVVGMRNMNSSHAVLAYKYLELKDGTVQLYVADSNIPPFSVRREYDKKGIEEILGDKVDINIKHLSKINDEIIRNCYITLKEIDGIVHFNFNPCINGNYFYEGEFNSFMPGSIFTIYCTN